MLGAEFTRRIGGVVCTKCQTVKCDCPRNKDEKKKKKGDIRVDTILNKEEFKKIVEKLDVMARA